MSKERNIDDAELANISGAGKGGPTDLPDDPGAKPGSGGGGGGAADGTEETDQAGERQGFDKR